MKTVSRMIRRYIAAAFAIVLLVFAVNAALLIGLTVYFGVRAQSGELAAEGPALRPIRALSESFTLDARGVPTPRPDRPLDAYSFAWAMLLDEDGDVTWRYNLPAHLDHRYTVPQVATFTRWYMDDYPIFVYKNDLGLLVCGMPRGSVVRYNFYMVSDILNALLSGIGPMLLLDLGLILALCLLLGWRAARGLRSVAAGIDRLAHGESVSLPETGANAELAHKLNRASEHLRRRDAVIRRRDNARTGWIAGVSHDIRTPLSLILLYAEALAQDEALEPEPRRKAKQIGAQGQKIRALIEDLNLTSKLQYGAEPLRISHFSVAALLRASVAAFCDSPSGARCPAQLYIDPKAAGARIAGDEALLRRAMDNLLLNSAQHNPQGCAISLSLTPAPDGGLTLALRDDGCGYPPAVLHVLCTPPDADPDAFILPVDSLKGPHILGLHLVRQIVQAHGGRVRFSNQGGASCEITLPPSA